jgi:hypothetical protein
LMVLVGIEDSDTLKIFLGWRQNVNLRILVMKMKWWIYL